MSNYFIPKIEYSDVNVRNFLSKRESRELILDTVFSEFHKKEKGFNPLWTLSEGGSFITTPLFYKDLVIFGCCDKNLYAARISNGEEVWRFGTDRAVTYLGCIHDERVFFGSYDGNIYCLDAETGEETWRHPVNSPMAYGPLFFDGLLYTGSEEGSVFALTPRGSLVWKFNANGPVGYPPFGHNGKVYFGSWDHNAYCLDARTGKMIWKYSTGGRVHSGFSFFKGNVVFSSYDKNVYCLNKDSGTLVWKRGFENIIENPSYPVKDGVIFMGSRGPEFFAIDMEAGKIKWKFSGNGMFSGAACISGNILYTGCGDQNVYAINADNGKLVWKYTTNGMIFSFMKVSEGVLYAGSSDCNMYALDTLTGVLIWKFASSLSYPAVVEMEEPVSSEETLVTIVTSDTSEKENLDAKPRSGNYGESHDKYTNISQYSVDENGVYSSGKKHKYSK